MIEAQERMEQMRGQARRHGESNKRAAWQALLHHTPEAEPLVRDLAARFGIDGVRVEADGRVWEWRKDA